MLADYTGLVQIEDACIHCNHILSCRGVDDTVNLMDLAFTDQVPYCRREYHDFKSRYHLTVCVAQMQVGLLFGAAGKQETHRLFGQWYLRHQLCEVMKI